MKLSEITSYLEGIAPLSIQESYDNSGLQVGDPGMDVTGILISLDITTEVLNEAIAHNCNLVITHHPLIFGGIRSISGSTKVERMIISAIKNGIAIYSGHTNFDSIEGGVNTYMANRIGLTNTRILRPAKGMLRKLVVFVPEHYAEPVREAMFSAGAGHIGEYDSCSFNAGGEGTFRGSEESNPFAGRKGELHHEPEIRIETIVPSPLISRVVKEMVKVHPYEEVAYDIYPLDNVYEKAGAGMIGDLPHPMKELDFLKLVKEAYQCGCIRHSKLIGKEIQRIALCGGAGSFLLKNALTAGADAFITGDLKYHQFFDAEEPMVILDIGHYESEQFTRDLFYDLLTKKLPKFAIRLSNIHTNPIKYF